MQNIFILTTLIATSAAWVIPTYVVRETTSATDTYIYSDISSTSTYIDKFTQTNTVTLSITTAPADATPITTITSADIYNEFTMEYIELAAADLPTPLPTAPYDPSTVPVYHYYIQKETYSNPASCSDVEPWTYSTRVTVSIPSEATYQVKPTSESTEIYTGWVSTVTNVYHFIAPGTVPTSTSSYYSYYGSSETDACEKPYAAYRYDDDDDDDDDYYNRWSTDSTSGSSGSSSRWDRYYGGSLQTYILVIIIVIPSVFVLGFVESYFWFTKLMKGRSALRGGTLLWVFISLWTACLIRSENAGVDPEWRKEAEAKWKARGLGEKLKLWLKYGFHWSYPVAVMGERNLPPKYVPAAAAAVVAPTAPGTTGVVAGSVETRETAGTGEGTRDVPGTTPPPYVDASRNPV